MHANHTEATIEVCVFEMHSFVTHKVCKEDRTLDGFYLWHDVLCAEMLSMEIIVTVTSHPLFCIYATWSVEIHRKQKQAADGPQPVGWWHGNNPKKLP